MAKPLTVEEAQQRIIAATIQTKITEMRDLQSSVGCVLAEKLVAPIAIPPFSNSAMDGFAVNTGDLQQGNNTLPISARIAAGSAPQNLEANTAARIFTGAPIPSGGNAVVIQENCDFDAESVHINAEVSEHDNIRPAGQDVQLGATIFEKGHRLRARDSALIAAVGLNTTRVYRPLRVALLNTGDELAEPGSTIEPGQIYNSNDTLVSNLLCRANCSVVSRITVADSLEASKQALNEACEKADIVITTGGVSVGEEDHVVAAVEALGEIDFYKVALKPGKPLMHGSIGKTPVIGLPGNPSSVLVTFLLFVLPMLRSAQGETWQAPLPYWLPASFSVQKPKQRREYLRVKRDAKGLNVHPNQSSGLLSSFVWSDGLALIEAGKTLHAGEHVAYYPYPLFFLGLLLVTLVDSRLLSGAETSRLELSGIGISD